MTSAPGAPDLRRRIRRTATEVARSTNDARREGAAACRRFWQRIRPPTGPAGSRLAPGTMEPLRGWSTAPANPARSDGVEHRDLLEIAVLVYSGVSSSEAQMVGDALARPFGAAVRLVSAEPGPVVGVEPARMVVAEPFSVVERPYGVVVPGGLAWKREAERTEVIEWLSVAVTHARGVIAVSTGSLLLAATGALDGQPAAGHWLAGELMAEFGVEPSSERVVHGRLVATASGALAGVEAAEALAKEMRFSV